MASVKQSTQKKVSNICLWGGAGRGGEGGYLPPRRPCVVYTCVQNLTRCNCEPMLKDSTQFLHLHFRGRVNFLFAVEKVAAEPKARVCQNFACFHFQREMAAVLERFL